MRLTAGAALLACSFIGLPAWALTLGPLTVQSSLGEPLRAQIELPGLTAEEFDSLQVQLGGPADFSAAQLPWQPLAGDVRFQPRRLDNGRTVLQLSTRQIVREPFLDLVVQAQSANGRLVRGYTLLFDPPGLKPALAAAPVAPRVQASPTAAPARPAVAASPAPTVAAATPSTPASVAVRPGQTAGQIAQAHQPAGATLEQMLVALLQANPQAFQGGNMNRLRSGSVLKLPSAEQAQAVSPEAARQVVAAQSNDFDAYRQRLAAASPAAAPANTGRESSGQVQAEVTDQRAEASAADRLTLARGQVDAELSAEAQRREQADQQARQAEVERNLAQLEQLQASAQAPAGTAAAPATPTATAPTPAAAVNAAPAAPASAASAASWLQNWLAHPLALPAAGGLAVALLVFGWLRRRRSHAPSTVAVSVVTSEPPAAPPLAPTQPAVAPPLPPHAEAQPSTLIFSASQLQHNRHADALAEADLFLAYGRHAQAEDILREALQESPDQPELLSKLLQVQRARQDADGFIGTATALWTLTGGEGEVWQEALALGRDFLPQHALFLDPDQTAPEAAQAFEAPVAAEPTKPDLPVAVAKPAAPAVPVQVADATPALKAPAAAPAFTAAVAQAAPSPDLPPITGEQRAASPAAEAPPDPVVVAAPVASQATTTEPPGLDFDLDMDFASPPPTAAASPAALAGKPAASSEPAPVLAPTPAAPPDLGNGIDFDLDLDLGPPTEAAPPAPSAASVAVPAATGADLLPPSLHDLSLDLDVQEDDAHEDPLETKLSLAREFAALGDTQGARILAEAVVSAADGDLQTRARAFLAELG